MMAAALSTVLGVGAELGATNNDSAIVTALRRGSTDSLNQTGQQVVRRNLNIQPTITIRPGFPVRVIVNRDLEASVAAVRGILHSERLKRRHALGREGPRDKSAQ